MEQTSVTPISTKKDYLYATAAGFLIGALAMPIVKAANPVLYTKIGFILLPFFLIGSPLGLLVAEILARKIVVIWQIAKFGLIGVLNTLVDMGVLALTIFAFRNYYQVEPDYAIMTWALGTITIYSLFKAFSFIVANLNSYFWNKHWTFHDAAQKKTQTEFLQFFIVSIIGFLVNVFVASYVFSALPASLGYSNDLLGQLGAAAGSVAGLVWNFLGYKFIVFKK